MMMFFAGEGWGEGMSRMVIDDEMWSRLEKLLPKPKGRHGEDDRLFMEAICWMLRTGAAWRDLPPDYGNWKSVYNRYNNWSKKGYITAKIVCIQRPMIVISTRKEILLSAFFRKLSVLEGLLQGMIKQPECTSLV